MREKILIDTLEEIKKINALSISGNSWAYHKDEINRVITKALSDYAREIRENFNDIANGRDASAPNPNRCKYEQLVEKFFGLPDTVDEKAEIKADFGLLVNLLAWASSAPESGQKLRKHAKYSWNKTDTDTFTIWHIEGITQTFIADTDTAEKAHLLTIAANNHSSAPESGGEQIKFDSGKMWSNTSSDKITPPTKDKEKDI